MISRDNAVRLDPLNSSLLSTPSMDKLLLRGRKPPNVNPLSANCVCAAPFCCGLDGATPGANKTNPDNSGSEQVVLQFFRNLWWMLPTTERIQRRRLAGHAHLL